MVDDDFARGRWRRLGRLGKLGAKAAGAQLMGKAGHKLLASSLVKELGQMKGLPMKVGQLLSYMDGLVPEEQRDAYAQTLAVLRANAPPVDNAGCLALLESELGAARAELFEEFSDEPMASASVGQVYAAVHEGREVCVKVQYPGIAEATEADLDNAEALIGVAQKIMPTLSMRSLVENFEARLQEEFDYVREAEHQRRFFELYGDSEELRVPRVVSSRSSARVLTTERISGQTLERFLDDATREERDAAGMALFRFAFGTLLGHGLFHADPHPGNLFFRSDGGRLGVIDYGCVQPFDVETLTGLHALLRAALEDEPLEGPVIRALTLDVDDDTLQMVVDFTRLMLRPVIDPQPFTFTPHFARDISRRVIESKLALQMRLLRRRARFGTKADGVMFIVRNLFGLASIWGQLEATGNYREEMQRMLSAPPA
jgi:predicted unusual protein kinase regulating ubiquinone biosynthesis (AarF/ABC1/UbiB family)